MGLLRWLMDAVNQWFARRARERREKPYPKKRFFPERMVKIQSVRDAVQLVVSVLDGSPGLPSRGFRGLCNWPSNELWRQQLRDLAAGLSALAQDDLERAKDAIDTAFWDDDMVRYMSGEA